MDTISKGLRAALDGAGVGIAYLSAKERFEDLNQVFCSYLTLDREALTGKSWRETVHPGDHHRMQAAYDSARHGNTVCVEVRGLGGDNRTVFHALQVTAVREPDGSVSGFYCIRHDNCGPKAPQTPLALAMEVAPSGLLILDPDGRILAANQAVERLFGYTRHELIGTIVEALLPHSVRQQHREHRERFNKDPHARRAGRDLRGRRSDGVEIPLQVYINLLDVPTGKLILCTIIDIAERVRDKEQLELARVAAESANRAKSDFLARMSHEIRTPMNLIMGMGALLLETELTGRQRQYLEVSHRNLKRLLRLTNGILDLSKVEAGKLTLDIRPFSVRDLVSEALTTIGPATERKGLLLHGDVHPGVWPDWKGDPERVQQILLNVLGNAVKFTDEGSITLSVTAARGAGGKDGLRFAVRDTGCGIRQEQAALIFDTFQQGDEALNRRYEGSGLGLAISRNLCQMMGGEIRLGEQSGPGTIVEFTIFPERCTPGDVAAASQARSAPRQAPPIAQGTRILVAEDNDENVLLLRAYLDRLPLVVDVAVNGGEAVEKAKIGSYDLILMDIQMPVLDGYSATKKIREWEQTHKKPRVPILTLSAHALIQAAEESARAGCDGHLTKPVEREDLIDAIAKYSRLRRSPPEAATMAGQIDKIRPEFLAKRRSDVTKLQKALEEADFDVMRRIGHDCKGMSKGFGFPDIGTAAAALESAARDSELPRLQEAVARFASLVESSSAALTPAEEDAEKIGQP